MDRQTKPAKPEEGKKDQGPNIPLWEWVLVLLIALAVDIGLEILDNVLLIGVAISWLIEFFFGLLLNFYWWKRGMKITLVKGLVQGAVLGFMTIGDGEAPFWWLDVVIMYLAYKAEKKIKEIPMAGDMLDQASKIK
jgi:hypothetical protein